MRINFKTRNILSFLPLRSGDDKKEKNVCLFFRVRITPERNGPSRGLYHAGMRPYDSTVLMFYTTP